MNFLTVKQLASKFPIFSEAALRHLIKHAKENGFEICIRRIGTKLLINVEIFETWIEEHKK
jgi:hypothetical protein